MSVTLETDSKPGIKIPVRWPEGLDHPDRQPERSVLTFLLGQPGDRITGEEALAELAAAVNLEADEAIRLLKRMAGRNWVGWNPVAEPRVWIPNATRQEIALATLSPRAAPLPAPGPKVEAQMNQTPARRPVVKSSWHGNTVIMWPAFLQGRHLRLTRAVITFLAGRPGYAIDGDEAFAQLVKFAHPAGMPQDPGTAMRSLARMSSDGWIGRSIFGSPRVWLTEKTLKVVEILTPSARSEQQRPADWRHNPEWRDLSACRTENPDHFFLDLDTPPKEVAAAEAELPGFGVCEKCPVRLDCLADGLLRKPDGFIYGGLSPREQHSIRRRRVYSGVHWVDNLLLALEALEWILSRRVPAAKPSRRPRRDSPGDRSPDEYYPRKKADYIERELEELSRLKSLALEVLRALLKERAGEVQVVFLNQRFTAICRRTYGISLSLGQLRSVKKVLVNEGWAQIWEKDQAPTRYRVLPTGQQALDQAA
jgi:WhiB family redox-sensing transcriptional regulator